MKLSEFQMKIFNMIPGQRKKVEFINEIKKSVHWHFVKKKINRNVTLNDLSNQIGHRPKRYCTNFFESKKYIFFLSNLFQESHFYHGYSPIIFTQLLINYLTKTNHQQTIVSIVLANICLSYISENKTKNLTKQLNYIFIIII